MRGSRFKYCIGASYDYDFTILDDDMIDDHGFMIKSIYVIENIWDLFWFADMDTENAFIPVETCG
jgi:hypothetical protein